MTFSNILKTTNQTVGYQVSDSFRVQSLRLCIDAVFSESPQSAKSATYQPRIYCGYVVDEVLGGEHVESTKHIRSSLLQNRISPSHWFGIKLPLLVLHEPWS